MATGPNGATIAIQAQNNSSGVLAGTTTTLQTMSGSFGSGSWSVSLTVNQVVAGRIVAALVGQPIGPANVPVTFNGGSSQQLVITQPTLNAQLPANFIVSGSGSNLPGNQVTVQAVTNGGAVLQTQQAFLQNIQPNGQGTWQANFSNVSAGAPTLGRIVASAAPAQLCRRSRST
ncbi:MAG: hypothetical protein IPK16_22835 [Anaerolineales bacterium]|nr:hypothetical protein [Anaerolineales bacterium]